MLRWEKKGDIVRTAGEEGMVNFRSIKNASAFMELLVNEGYACILQKEDGAVYVVTYAYIGREEDWGIIPTFVEEADNYGKAEE